MAAAKQRRMAANELIKHDDRLRGSELCTRCGLCCTGALHDTAKLDADEVVGATALGLPVVDRESPCFALPCPKLEGTLCGIYGNRPRVCGRYRCGLLQKLEAGDVSFEAAAAKVDSAQGLVARVRDLAPPGMTLPHARALALAEPKGGETAQMHLRLAATAMVMYIDRNFRNEREGPLVRLTSVEPALEMETDEHANVQKI